LFWIKILLERLDPAVIGRTVLAYLANDAAAIEYGEFLSVCFITSEGRRATEVLLVSRVFEASEAAHVDPRRLRAACAWDHPLRNLSD
jgi:hypothetical protein